MHRKTLIAGAVVALVGALALTSCSADAGGNPTTAPAEDDTVLGLSDLSGQTIDIYTYGGTFAESFTATVVDPFEAATGATVNLITTCCEAFQSSVEADQPIGDIVLGNDYGPMLQYSEQGLLLEDDRLTEIAEARGIDENYYQSDLLAVDFYGYVLAWNTDNAGDNHPTTWEEFLDTDKFTGSRGLFNLPNSMLEAATLGAGLATAEDLYPLDIDADIDTLNTLRDNSEVKFWTEGASLQNSLGTGEMDYAVAFSNRVIQGRQAGLPIDASFEGALLTASGAGIPANAKNVDGAVAFLDFYLQPKIQAAFAEVSALAPAYPSANEYISDDLLPYMITAPDNIDKAIRIDDAWWGENAQEATDKYTAWVNQ